MSRAVSVLCYFWIWSNTAQSIFQLKSFQRLKNLQLWKDENTRHRILSSTVRTFLQRKLLQNNYLRTILGRYLADSVNTTWNIPETRHICMHVFFVCSQYYLIKYSTILSDHLTQIGFSWSINKILSFLLGILKYSIKNVVDWIRTWDRCC